MKQRLIWNFEFSNQDLLPLDHLVADKEEHIKWEIRFFWEEGTTIKLHNLDHWMLSLANYKQKNRVDQYFLLPDTNDNIKLRGQELIYKPVIQQKATAIGFGPKINLDEEELDEMKNLAQKARQEGISLLVKKEVYSYKCPTTPSIKLELAKLEIKEKTYFSACLEGKSFFLVEYLSQHLLGKQHSCDYVTFLKNILNS